MKKILTVLALSLALLGCTEQQQAKKWGGKYTIDLPPGTKLVTATWKDSDLWYLYRNRHPGERPETFIFQEDSSMGVFEGRVTFREH